jgi:site-specific DNA recombinase
MVVNLLMTVAQWEREVIGERTRDAPQAKIARGERCGKIRFGYDLSADGKSLVKNEREQEAIRQMRAWRAQGKTYRDLVKLVEDFGIDTKEGNRVWVPTTIRRILCRPIA